MWKKERESSVSKFLILPKFFKTLPKSYHFFFKIRPKSYLCLYKILPFILLLTKPLLKSYYIWKQRNKNGYVSKIVILKYKKYNLYNKMVWWKKKIGDIFYTTESVIQFEAQVLIKSDQNLTRSDLLWLNPTKIRPFLLKWSDIRPW